MKILEETKRVCLEDFYQHYFIAFLHYVPRGYNVSKAKEHISGASFPIFFCAGEKTIKKALFNNPIVRLRSIRAAAGTYILKKRFSSTYSYLKSHPAPGGWLLSAGAFSRKTKTALGSVFHIEVPRWSRPYRDLASRARSQVFSMKAGFILGER